MDCAYCGINGATYIIEREWLNPDELKNIFVCGPCFVNIKINAREKGQQFLLTDGHKCPCPSCKIESQGKLFYSFPVMRWNKNVEEKLQSLFSAIEEEFGHEALYSFQRERGMPKNDFIFG